jgi:hypothetical protein
MVPWTMSREVTSWGGGNEDKIDAATSLSTKEEIRTATGAPDGGWLGKTSGKQMGMRKRKLGHFHDFVVPYSSGLSSRLAHDKTLMML